MAGKRIYKLRIAYTIELEADNNYDAIQRVNIQLGIGTNDLARNIRIETVGSREISTSATQPLTISNVPEPTNLSKAATDSIF